LQIHNQADQKRNGMMTSNVQLQKLDWNPNPAKNMFSNKKDITKLRWVKHYRLQETDESDVKALKESISIDTSYDASET